MWVKLIPMILVIALMAGCREEIIYKDGWYVPKEVGETEESVADSSILTEHETQMTASLSDNKDISFPKMVVIADRSESIYGSVEKGKFKGPDKFCNIYQCLDFFKRDYNDIDVYVGNAPKVMLDPVSIKNIKTHSSESLSWLELLDHHKEVLEQKLRENEGALFVFVTDFETTDDVEQLADLFNDCDGTGMTIYVFKDHYHGNIDYYRKNTQYETGRIEQYETDNCVIEEADLDRYYLVIAYGVDEDVHVFMDEFSYALDQTELNSILDSQFHFTRNEIVERELDYPLSVTPSLTSDMKQVVDYKVNTSNYLFGTDQYFEDDIKWTDPNTYLFERNTVVSKRDAAKKIILYMDQPSLLGQYRDMEIDFYKRTKSGWNTEGRILDVRLLDEAGILEDCGASYQKGCKVLPFSNLTLDEMNNRWVNDLTDKRFAIGENGIFGLVLQTDQIPRGTFAIEIRLKFTDDYDRKEDCAKWASKYNQKDDLKIEDYMEVLGEVNYRWPMVLSNNEDLKEFGKLRNFSNFVNKLSDWHSLHEERTYTIRLHLEGLNGKKD